MKIDENALRVVLNNMPDGFTFEGFAQKILTRTFGDKFIPVGGSGDQGIDGFKYTYYRERLDKLVYQISTEIVHWKQEQNKIIDTYEKLIKNKIEFDKLNFVTNRKVERKDLIQDRFYSKYGKDLTILDMEWFVSNITSDPNNADIYKSFLENHYHEYNRPEKLVEIGDFSSDPRLYVFLRQQIDEVHDQNIEENILDGLILYSLEGTASEKEIFMSSEEILTSIKDLTKYNLNDIKSKIENRLLTLSEKSNQKVKHHTKANNYCLPYDTRVELKERDLLDKELQKNFKEETIEMIKNNLKILDVNAKNIYEVFEEILHSIYYRQGLEFSEFILNNSNKDTVDDSLQAIVAKVVDETSIKIENRSKVKTALLVSLREITYNGTETQREYLRRLSKTYMMVFLTQNDPKISLFFQSLANKLNVFVGTSIIIPALSEYFLENENKRYWNLLKGAKASGVSLRINEYIVDELVSHLEGIFNKYLSLYKSNEEEYLHDEITLLYIDDILIRAYYYAKRRGRIKDFQSYLMKFIDPQMKSTKEDIIFYLKEEFGIEYVPTSSENIQIDEEEVNLLTKHLKEKKKGSQKRAEVDARLILHVYKLREKNKETDSSGIFGYKTWWLSQDINTFKSVREIFDGKYTVSCYMRADFMYKYISLSPKKDEIDLFYRQCFPNLMGVNLSYHIPPGISEFVSQKLEEHKDTNPMVVKRTLKNLTERLMSSIESATSKEFKGYFEKEMDKMKTDY